MANQMLYATLQLELRAARAELTAATAERARYGDAMTERLADVEAERDTARAEVDALREEIATLRLVAQAALTRAIAEEYEQALEDIASEEQGK